MRPLPRSHDREIARIASDQQGVITRAQLLAIGLTREAIRWRVRTGLLYRVFRGVYRVGHCSPSVEARYMAAVLACGDGAVLSGFAAAFLYGLIKGAPPVPEVSSTAERRIEGVITRRVRRLERSDVTEFRDIPITSVARTIADLAPRLSLDALARVCHEAEVRYEAQTAAMREGTGRLVGFPGAGGLRAVLIGDVRVTLSALERRFISLLRGEGLPLPETNRRDSNRRFVDCRWPEYRLTVELDSYRFHRSRYAWEQDRRREREARARGDEFRRYTYGDVVEDPLLMLTELRSLLATAA